MVTLLIFSSLRALILLGFLPLAAIFYRLIRSKLPRRRLAARSIYLVCCLLFAWGGLAAVFALTDRLTPWADEIFAGTEQKVLVRDGILEMDGKGGMHVILAMENRTPRPVFFDGVEVACHNPRRQDEDLQADKKFRVEPEARFVVVEPKTGSVVSVVGRIPTADFTWFIAHTKCVANFDRRLYWTKRGWGYLDLRRVERPSLPLSAGPI